MLVVADVRSLRGGQFVRRDMLTSRAELTFGCSPSPLPVAIAPAYPQSLEQFARLQKG